MSDIQKMANNLNPTDKRTLQFILVSKVRGTDGDNVRNGCYDCEHKRSVAGNAHIECVKPDVFMTGNKHGIANGWFMYPLLFDPTWMTKECCNFDSVSLVGKSNGKSE